MTAADKSKSMISIVFDAEKQPIDFGKECPQVFTRKGTLRKPKATLKIRRSTGETVRLWRNEMKKIEGILLVAEAPEIRFITHERIDVVLRGEAAVQFINRDEDGLLDAIGAGWQILIS